MALRFSLVVFAAAGPIERLIESHYPSHYVVSRLGAGQRIEIDGHLDEEAWREVPWLENFLDLAGRRFPQWQQASRDYARRVGSLFQRPSEPEIQGKTAISAP